MSSLFAGFSAAFETVAAVSVSRRLTSWQSLILEVAKLEDPLQGLDDAQLRKESFSLQYRAKAGEPLDQLLPEAYALVREAGRRALAMRHYDVQVLGGVAMHHRTIVEMQTGEGKTLTAALPLYLASLLGKGAHLATANDYLAERDAELMRPLFGLLGISVGVILSQMPPADRQHAYACDITYGTAKEFGFDFLRDRLIDRRNKEQGDDFLGRMLGHDDARGREGRVQRSLSFMLVDEADSILIDEARTPLVISALPGAGQSVVAHAYRWAAEAASKFDVDKHYTYDAAKRRIELTPAGRRQVRTLPKPGNLSGIGMFSLYEYCERAIKVGREMICDRHYVVRDGEVAIVDEFTGRIAEGRKWRTGIHQAIEAKEGLDITLETNQAARITVQDFFLRYEKLAGMTGTAVTSSRELAKIYGLRVVPIPTNRPPIREELSTRVFAATEAKWAAIVDEVAAMHFDGRPVLVGTRSIDKSEAVSRLLAARGIRHEVLNANALTREAEIIAQAGERCRVTVSTNMAGRGTDIRLGPGVESLGGLHVICTELHESQRIDRQLIGRCGRQGDPGTFRQYLALDDDIVQEGLGERTASKLKDAGALPTCSLDRYESLLRTAQKRIERRHFRDRKVLLHQEKQRHEMLTQMGQDPYLDAS